MCAWGLQLPNTIAYKGPFPPPHSYTNAKTTLWEGARHSVAHLYWVFGRCPHFHHHQVLTVLFETELQATSNVNETKDVHVASAAIHADVLKDMVATY